MVESSGQFCCWLRRRGLISIQEQIRTWSSELRERERGREREIFGDHLLHATLCIKPFILLLIRCPHGTVLVDMVDLDRMAAGIDCRRGSWGVKSEVHSEDERFCQKCSTGNWWSRTDCRHCASVTNETADGTEDFNCRSTSQSRSKTLDEQGSKTSLCQQAGEFCEKAGSRCTRRTSDGPKNTAKHIEAKLNWINRESKRIEAESAKLAEMQENLRVWKETLSVAHEAIMILRADLLREGESMDKKR